MIPRLIHYEYTRPGKETKFYDQWLVHESESIVVLFTERYAGPKLSIEGEQAMDVGGSILWFLFPGAWHDIGKFYLSDGTFTGWYTNLCTPWQANGDDWSSTDLFLDHWISVAGKSVWLDEDEFEEACAKKLLTEDQQERTREQRDQIQQKINAKSWPPAEVEVMDLEEARATVQS